MRTFALRKLIQMGKYINPFTDWGFKRIFGQEVNKDLLIDFLNELFAGEHHIHDIKFRDKEVLGEKRDMKNIVFDIFCDTDDGKHIIVEMQNSAMKHYIDRSIFYLSRVVSEQGVIGDWDYDLSHVYIISFLNFKPGDGALSKFRTDGKIRDTVTGEVLSEKVRFIYLVLPYFQKEPEECESNFDCWIYVLNNMETLERMPFLARNAVFKKLAEITDISTMTMAERRVYDENLKIMRDHHSVYKTGFEEGEAKGILKGKAEGRTETLHETARNLKREGVPVSIIMKATSLSEEEINQL